MTRIEAAQEAMRATLSERGEHLWPDVENEAVRAALAAADAHDAANGVHRVSLDASVGRVSQALYEHRAGALTCYDHTKPGQWCCVCGEHLVTEPYRRHVARAVLAAAVKEDGA